jgi:glycosyltransferase involved in cell wall biosynthesis
MGGSTAKSILFLIDELTLGGAQTVLNNVVVNLDRQSFQPFVISLFEDGRVGDSLRGRGISTQCLQMRSGFRIRSFLDYLPVLLDFVRSHRIRLIHSFLTASGIYGGIVARIAGICSILSVHGPLSKNRVRLLELVARNLNDILVAGNRLTLEELQRTRFWRKADSLKLIYNGIRPEGEARTQSFSSDTVNITMVANFFPEKDHLTLVKAFAVLQARHPLRLRIVAAGENQHREKVLQYIAERRIQGIELQSTRDVDLYTHKTDIFVLTSHSEGLPLSVAEAMSAGLPVVASDVGAMREIIDHRVDGILVPPRSVEAVVDAVEELIHDKELRDSLSINAVAKFHKRFGIERMTKEYHSLYAFAFGRN